MKTINSISKTVIAHTGSSAGALVAAGEKHNKTILKKSKKMSIVIGIDPGSQKTGWGVVREASGVLELLACGIIRPKPGEFSDRLGVIFKDLQAVLRQYQPDEAAIENVFAHKNPMTALKLGQARGIAVGACAALDIPVVDYEPTLIKKTLTGNGRAEKSQVSFMVARMLGAKESWGEDAGDALAAAICHLNMRRFNKLAAKK